MERHASRRLLQIIFALTLGAWGCSSERAEQRPVDPQDTEQLSYRATLEPTSGSTVAGAVTFTPHPDGGVRVTAMVTGLESGGTFGIHIHEKGDCSAPDGSSAGGHFNPDGSPHGAPSQPASERHAGDLGNLEELAEGVAEFESRDLVIQLTGADAIDRKAVVVHSKADDFTTQPTGNAGARLACGVIGKSTE